MKHYKTLFLVSLLGLLSLFAGCDSPRPPTSDQLLNRQQEAMAQQAAMSVGMPAVPNFQEKRILKEIIELRDTAVVTYSYTQDMQGKYNKLCDSIGYGISAATQFTNPMKTVTINMVAGHWETVVVPQADPNGLFSPATAEGTWVYCKVPGKDKNMPVYVEPRVIVSPFPLVQG